jgi:hypothetical protein
MLSKLFKSKLDRKLNTPSGMTEILAFVYLLLIIAISISLLTCDTCTPNRAGKGTPETSNHYYYNDNGNDNGNDDDDNDNDGINYDDTALNGRVDDLELKIKDVESSQSKLDSTTIGLSLQLEAIKVELATVKSRYKDYDELFQSLNVKLTNLEYTVTQNHVWSQEQLSVLKAEFVTLLQSCSSSNNTIQLVLAQIDSLNSQVANNSMTIESLQIVLSSIETSLFTEAQIQSLIRGMIDGYSYFINPCGLTSTHTELVFILGGLPYAWFRTNGNTGGLVKLEFNTVYQSTVGQSCKFKINSNLTITIL